MRLVLLIIIFFFLFFATFGQPPGSSIILNGINDYVTVPDNGSLDQTDTVTIEAWINPCKVSGNNFIATKLWCSGSQDAYYLSVRDGKLIWHWNSSGYCGGTTNLYESVNPIILTNQWQHVAVVHTPTAISLYYNGNLVSAVLANGSYGNIINSSEPLRIGVYKAQSGPFMGYFLGRIDELRIWNYDLSAVEIQNRMNIPLSGNETGLQAYYNMDNTGAGQGITVPNSATTTGAINNGTTVGTFNTPYFLPNTTGIISVDLGNDTTLCQGDTLVLDATVSNASYLWQDNSTNATYSVMQQGTYWVEVSEYGCIYKDTIHVFFDSIPTVNLGNDSTLCDGDTLSLDAFFSNAVYLWQDSSANATYNVTQQGIYWVEVSYNDCTNKDTIHVFFNSIPFVNIGNDSTLCEGEIMSLDASYPNGSYLWQDGFANAVYSVFQQGIYWVEVKNSCGTATDTISIDYNPLPVVDLDNDTTLCEGDILFLDATVPGGSYLWQDNSTNATYAVEQQGIYWVEVSANGCANNDTVYIDFIPSPSVDLGNDSTLCNGDIMALNATFSDASYQWQDNSTNATFNVIQQGTYWVEVENNCGTAADTIQFDYNPIPVVDLASDANLCDSEVINLDATFPGASYLWQDGSTNATYSAALAGIYWVEAELNGCSSRDTIIISGGNCETELFIPNVFTPNSDGENDLFLIKGKQIISLNTKIYNRWGTLIFESNLINQFWNGKTIQGRENVEGTYFYIITVATIQKTETFQGLVTLLR